MAYQRRASRRRAATAPWERTGKLLNEPGDMKWLRDVHIKSLSSRFRSAVLYGNEDCPAKVELYQSANPSIHAQKIVYKRRGSACRLKRK